MSMFYDVKMWKKYASCENTLGLRGSRLMPFLLFSPYAHLHILNSFTQYGQFAHAAIAAVGIGAEHEVSTRAYALAVGHG